MPAALPDGAMLRGELYQASHCDATISIHKKWKSVNKNLKNPRNFHENSMFCTGIFHKHKMLYFYIIFLSYEDIFVYKWHDNISINLVL